MKGIGPFLNRDLGGSERGVGRNFFSNLPTSLDMLDYCVDFDDFTSSVLDQTNEWISIIDTACTTLMGTGDVENGAVTLLSAATTDNVGAAIQRAETCFLIKTGKQLWFEARVKVGDADQGEMFIGLADNFITDPEAVIVGGVARVGFELIDGAATINTVIDDDATSVKTILSTSMVDDTYVRLGFRTEGASIRFYVDRALVSTQALPAAIAAVTLGPAFFHLSGDATGTHKAMADYIFAAQKRI